MGAPLKGPTLRRRLGAELRRLREAAGLTVEQAGAVIYGSDSKISRLENGRGALKPLEIQALLARYGAANEQRQRLMQMVEEADQPESWAGYAVPAGLETLLGLETDASRLEVFSALIIYGLLQTQEYASATIQEGRFTDPDTATVDSLVALRMHRQQILKGEDAPELVAVIDEAALRRVVGGSEVMRGQVQHLIDVGKYPRVSIQVLPNSVGAHAAQTGSFLRLVFPNDADSDLVYCDSAAGNQYVKKPGTVQRFEATFRRLRNQALSPTETEEFLTHLYREYR